LSLDRSAVVISDRAPTSLAVSGKLSSTVNAHEESISKRRASETTDSRRLTATLVAEAANTSEVLHVDVDSVGDVLVCDAKADVATEVVAEAEAELDLDGAGDVEAGSGSRLDVSFSDGVVGLCSAIRGPVSLRAFAESDGFWNIGVSGPRGSNNSDVADSDFDRVVHRSSASRSGESQISFRTSGTTSSVRFRRLLSKQDKCMAFDE
uniref:DOMON domain-containing protein n=1 Tax=Echinostoma caproni TaxID=27848 RepID=A0A183ASM9_9TREM